MGDKRAQTIIASIGISATLIGVLFVGVLRALEVSDARVSAFYVGSLDDYIGEEIELEQADCTPAVSEVTSEISANTIGRKRLSTALEELSATFDDTGPTVASYEWFRDSQLAGELDVDVRNLSLNGLQRSIEAELGVDKNIIQEEALSDASSKNLSQRLAELQSLNQLPAGVQTGTWWDAFLEKFTTTCRGPVSAAANAASAGFSADALKLAELVSNVARGSWTEEGYTKIAPLVAYVDNNRQCTSGTCATFWVLSPVECEVEVTVEFTNSNNARVGLTVEQVSVNAGSRKNVEAVFLGSGDAEFFEVLGATCS